MEDGENARALARSFVIIGEIGSNARCRRTGNGWLHECLVERKYVAIEEIPCPPRDRRIDEGLIGVQLVGLGGKGKEEIQKDPAVMLHQSFVPNNFEIQARGEDQLDHVADVRKPGIEMRS